jgi:hypothetical protein
MAIVRSLLHMVEHQFFDFRLRIALGTGVSTPELPMNSSGNGQRRVAHRGESCCEQEGQSVVIV